MARTSLLYRLSPIVLVVVFAVFMLFMRFTDPEFQHEVQVNYNYYLADEGGPPKYQALREWEAALPQHSLSLTFPEGKTGRYVKFSNQANFLGWNNCFNEVLMNAHLAYISGRAYVFQEYRWAHDHYASTWPKDTWLAMNPQTPLNAIVSGPVAGGPFEPDNPAPRAISENWFDVVCPPNERRYINTRDVKRPVSEAPGIDVLTHWQKLLRAVPERCVEIVSAEEDPWPQTFDLPLWSSPRILTLWDSFSSSPISRLLHASPIVRAAIASNTHRFLPWVSLPLHLTPPDPFARMLALHLRRGDYEAHCGWLAYLNTRFYSWNLFPHLYDRFVPEPDVPGKDERFFARCLPDQAGVVRKAAEVRRDYLAHAIQSNATLDVLYILTNEKSVWITALKKMLHEDGWKVTTSQDLVLDAEQTEVSMAVDMEIGRRAAVFVGNGWSSFTSNIVYQRLLDKRDPVTIRFT
ncbi:hypothetical protein B0H13DRAFT_2192958 [Mycena leptocephala]|nr:hypothetical protein B0H13DRAFT_2192958 [Mycena leptocephala]